MTDTQIIQAARNVHIEPNISEGFRQVTPGVFLFNGCDLRHPLRRVFQYYAVQQAGAIRIEQYR